MIDGPYFAEVGALIGDPARAAILAALLDGRALSATELSQAAGVSPQTTSGHLAKLTEGRLLTLDKQGRHRYYRLASPQVAEALEALQVLAVDGPPRYRPPGPRDQAMRQARTCYDHLAGRLGVALADALIEQGALVAFGRDFRLTEAGQGLLDDLGVDWRAAQAKRRIFARQCLDWSERRPHLGGALGAALAERCFAQGWAARGPDSRTVEVSRKGRRALSSRLGVSLS
ncbi:MAG: helix-turn-helix domain-containing protein [Pseudomonadota bacterium]